MSEIVLDHVADANGAELHRLSKLYEFPDFVKQADLDETLRPGKLAASVYADPRTADKLYPCHTPASTWLSCLYFEEKQGSFHKKDRPLIRERLDHYAEYWGVKEAVDAMREAHSEMHKNADDLLPDADFVFVRVLDTGHKERHWRLKNAAEVKAAAASLHEYRDHLPFTDRNVIAAKVLEKAAAYGASLGDHEQFVERQAGRGVCNPDDVVQMLKGRAKLARDAQHRTMITKLAEIVESKPASALTPDMLVKLAETVDMVDRANGLVRNNVGYYTDVLPRPEDVIFASTYKEVAAGVGAACALTTGSVYDKTEFSKVSADDLANLFGPDILNQVTTGLDVDAEKLAELAETFPRPDAELFEDLLKATGIPPMAHKAASDHVGLSPTMLESLARNYQR
jgi:hypothetical protein